MKFTSLIISSLFMALFSSCIFVSSGQLIKLSARRNEIRRGVMCKKFVQKSFKDTCYGKGFENLTEWQKSCGAIFQLEMITFSEDDSAYKGSWIFDSERYEVSVKK